MIRTLALYAASTLWGCGEVGLPTVGAGDDDDDSQPPTAVPGDSGRAPPQLFMGEDLACAVVSPSLRCWGAGGIVSGPEARDGVVELDLGRGRIASRLAIGLRHACALLSSGDILCWGGNDDGQLGLGDTSPRDISDGLDDIAALDLGESSVAVAVGTSHSCALSRSGVARCWGAAPAHGAGTTAALGATGGEPLIHLFPLDLGAAIEAIAAGSGHTCALLVDGMVKCWGANDVGQLGLGDTTPRGELPGDVGPALPSVVLGGRALAVASGRSVSCALLEEGKVKCWGDGEAGVLGTGDRNDRGDEPTELQALLPINLPRPALAVHTSGRHTCARLDDETLRCWGSNWTGALGLGHADNVGDTPSEMGRFLQPVDLGGRVALQVVLGNQRTCAWLDDDTARCWGDDVGDEPGEMGDDLAAIEL